MVGLADFGRFRTNRLWPLALDFDTVPDLRTKILRPIYLRLFGLSNLVLDTSDRALPKLELHAVKGGPAIREKLRKYVELLRDKKRVREVDFEGGEDGEMEMM